jgi:S1-C subfamily serine protease
MEDPRTVFHAGQDRQVLVLFEWQGPAGRHHCEGAWKDPSGRVVFTSTADVDARGPRFAVYWGLSLPDTVATGSWVVEAAVDGEAAGAHAFRIVAAAADASAPPARRALALNELYQKGLAVTLLIEALDGPAATLGHASGLFVSRDLVLTTFGVLNGARRVRVVTGDGRRLETADVVSWNRRADWAFLRVAGAGGQPIERAPARPGIGDRCYFLDTQADGSRSIVEATVSGTSGADELVISEITAWGNLGAPVLNEYGETIGTTAGPGGVVGASALDLVMLGPEIGGSVRGGRVRDLPSLPPEGSASRTLEDLDRAGEFVPTIAGTPHFVQGVLGTGVQRQGPAQIPVAVDQRFRFSRREESCVVFVTWTPARKEDSTVAFELFDEDNRRVGGTDPTKAKLRPSQSFVQYWAIPLSRLAPGIYRVDVRLGSEPVWRTYFRVTE